AGLLLASILFFPAQPAVAQAGNGEVVLVLPFENVSDHPEYNWIGESFADSMSVLLDKPGLIVVTSDERAVAYQRLRLPLTVIPSRATAIKIARELKASLLVFGTYNITPAPAARGRKIKIVSLNHRPGARHSRQRRAHGRRHFRWRLGA